MAKSDVVNIRFTIEYKSSYGQSVGMIGSHELLGSWNTNKPLLLNYQSDGTWEVEIDFPASFDSFSYKYFVQDQQGLPIRWEGQGNREFRQVSGFKKLHVRDFWREDIHGPEAIFRSAAYRDVIFRRQQPQALPPLPVKEEGKAIVVFEVEQIRVKSGWDVRLSGSGASLGEWRASQSIQASDASYPTWRVSVSLSRRDIPLRYKYLISNGTEHRFENGSDRVFSVPPLDDRDLYIVRDHPFVADRGAETFRGAGVAVPVFSLRSRKSFGVGEFLDINLLVDWAVQSGLRVVQVLPINDTCVHGTWWDTYPYSSLSVFALHPMYLSLEALNPSADILADIATARPGLNDGFVKYEEMMATKKKLLHRIFQAQKKEFLASDEFKQFFSDNENWLAPYALFCTFRDKYNTSNFHQWGEHSKITTDEIKKLTAPSSANYDSLAFVFYQQFHLDKQMRAASNYAMEHGVVLKGDLPIGVDPLSVDVWVNPHLFRTQVQVGAPPDAFSADGQNWGFPAYDWEAMAKDDYAWWRQRLRVLAKYFHAFRIDHILGFFRIWEIPQHCVGGLIGRFNPSIPVWHWELENNGLRDFDRLTKPFVRNFHFENLFEEKTRKQVISKYFDETSPGVFDFKPEYNTEKKLEQSVGDDEKGKELKAQLFSLLRNVIFIRDFEDPYRFYPRINLFNTDSYHSLSDNEKQIIYKIYISYFYERQDVEWRWRALQKLPVMQQTTDMLVCGEDLGMIPNCVEGVMDELSILGLRIQRMPKDAKLEFDNPASYPYMTVCTPSVHDTSTLRGFWEEDRQLTQRFYNQILREDGTHPFFCEPWVVEKILKQHFHSPSALTIICLQDFFALTDNLRLENPEDERINVPAIRHHYWRYRMQLTLEDLIDQHPYLAYKIRQDLALSERLL